LLFWPFRGFAVSGCGGLFIWAADALHPASVTSVDVVWSKNRSFCDSLIKGTSRYQFLASGNLDDPEYRPRSQVHPMAKNRMHGHGLDISDSLTVVSNHVTYAYAGRASIPSEDTSFLPIPEAEADYAESAIMDAWQEALYRVNFDGTLSQECVFVTRRWINWSL
jgi:hypothetical protein